MPGFVIKFDYPEGAMLDNGYSEASREFGSIVELD